MDLTTLIIAAGLFFGAIVGNAALFGNSLYVTMTIPTQMESSGLSKETAEQLFIADINRYLHEQSILPTPSISISTASSLPMALAKPLLLQDVVYSVQAMVSNYGVVHVDASVVADEQAPGIKMYMVTNNPPDPPVSTTFAQPDGNTKALIQNAARETMLAIGPFRVAITDFAEGVSGDAAGFDRSKQAISFGLAQPWDARALGATETILLLNLRGVLAIRDGNLADAEKDFARAKRIPGGFAESYGLISMNQTFLAIAEHQPEQAALRYNEGAAYIATLQGASIAARLRTIAGLVAWSNGENAVAAQDFRAAIAVSDTDQMPHLYLAQLLMAHGDTTGATAERDAANDAQRYDARFPSLAYTSFQFDLAHGGYKPVF